MHNKPTEAPPHAKMDDPHTVERRLREVGKTHLDKLVGIEIATVRRRLATRARRRRLAAGSLLGAVILAGAGIALRMNSDSVWPIDGAADPGFVSADSQPEEKSHQGVAEPSSDEAPPVNANASAADPSSDSVDSLLSSIERRLEQVERSVSRIESLEQQMRIEDDRKRAREELYQARYDYVELQVLQQRIKQL